MAAPWEHRRNTIEVLRVMESPARVATILNGAGRPSESFPQPVDKPVDNFIHTLWTSLWTTRPRLSTPPDPGGTGTPPPPGARSPPPDPRHRAPDGPPTGTPDPAGRTPTGSGVDPPGGST